MSDGFKWDYVQLYGSKKVVRLRVRSNATGNALAMLVDNRPGFADWLGKMTRMEEALVSWDRTGKCPWPEHADLAEEVTES